MRKHTEKQNDISDENDGAILLKTVIYFAVSIICEIVVLVGCAYARENSSAIGVWWLVVPAFIVQIALTIALFKMMWDLLRSFF